MTRARERTLRVTAIGLVIVTVLGAVLSSRSADWHPAWLFVTLTVLAIGAEQVRGWTGALHISASFLMFALAMALLGPAPAVAISFIARTVASVRFDGWRLEGRRLAFVMNLGMYVYVLAGGLALRAVGDAGVSRASAGFALAVIAVMSAGNVLNFLLAAIYPWARRGLGIREQFRREFVPAFPWVAAPNFLAGALVTLYANVGAASLALALALLGAFYLLLIELLRSRERSEQLEERSRQLASLHLGVMVTMVKTLSLRDKSTARHSAAVARYSCAIAKATGYQKADQHTVHMAGLLHDIGKFAFPDHILHADGGLTDEDWQIIEAHPADGARLVGSVEGYDEIAGIILAHHERIDGTGYPHGLRADEIPPLSRMISVADVYDVLTGRDTYRLPLSQEEAIAELRRTAGTQLDEQFVDVFIEVLRSESVGFTHTTDADFEAELDFEERVHELAAPRIAA